MDRLTGAVGALTSPLGPHHHSSLHAGKGWRAELRDVPVLPLHVTGEAGATVYAIVTPAAAAPLDDLGFYVDRLGAEGEPLTSDLHLLLDDRQLSSGFLTLDGNSTDAFEAGSASLNSLSNRLADTGRHDDALPPSKKPSSASCLPVLERAWYALPDGGMQLAPTYLRRCADLDRVPDEDLVMRLLGVLRSAGHEFDFDDDSNHE